MKEIKKRIRQFRNDKGYTMAEFAKKVGVSAGNVGDWESESRTSVPGAQALITIAQTFNISIDWLLMGIETNQEEASNEKAYSEHIQAAYAANPELFSRIMDIAFRMNEEELLKLLKFAEANQQTDIPYVKES